MSRKNIFEILAETNDLEKDVERIDQLFGSEKLLVRKALYKDEIYTIKCFVAQFCFDYWKNRGHCIDLDDFLEAVDYDGYCDKAMDGDIDAFFVFLEIVINCWKLAELCMAKNEEIKQLLFRTIFLRNID